MMRLFEAAAGERGLCAFALEARAVQAQAEAKLRESPAPDLGVTLETSVPPGRQEQPRTLVTVGGHFLSPAWPGFCGRPRPDGSAVRQGGLLSGAGHWVLAESPVPRKPSLAPAVPGPLQNGLSGALLCSSLVLCLQS